MYIHDKSYQCIKCFTPWVHDQTDTEIMTTSRLNCQSYMKDLNSISLKSESYNHPTEHIYNAVVYVIEIPLLNMALRNRGGNCPPNILPTKNI